MKENFIYLLKCFAGLSLGVGICHFLNSLGLIDFFRGWVFLLPMIISIVFAFFIIFKTFRGRWKFEIPILISLIIAGVSLAAMFGHEVATNKIEDLKLQ